MTPKNKKVIKRRRLNETDVGGLLAVAVRA